MNSTWPAAKSALLAVFGQLSNQNPPQGDYTGLTVVDGVWVGETRPDNYIQVVGMSGRQVDWRGLGDLRRTESYNLDCELFCWQGSDDDTATSTVEDLITGLVEQLHTLLFAQMDNAALQTSAGLTSWLIDKEAATFGQAGDNGWAVLDAFSVHCQSLSLER